jgi:antitoxin component YwqK of YwqJK toxin-antitoxin module
MLVYYQNGVVEVSGMYVNNFKDGIWMYFSDRGETIKKETFKEGRLKKTEKF